MGSWGPSKNSSILQLPVISVMQAAVVQVAWTSQGSGAMHQGCREEKEGKAEDLLRIVGSWFLMVNAGGVYANK